MAEDNFILFWNETVNIIKDKISPQEFDMWFNSISFNSSEDKTIVLNVPSQFFLNQIMERFDALIHTILFELTGQKISVNYKINKDFLKEKKQIDIQKDKTEKKEKKSPKKVFTHAIKNHNQLNKDYTFKKFVIGENNKFAANAAKAIADKPGTAYNPCLIHGGVGLGKTHLMQSIGNEIYSKSDLKIVFIPAETFINEFIQSIKTNNMHQFKKKYRSVDILLIDDIHDFQNKKETQEELFHTFNALYDSNKQLVFTSDRPVHELKEFTDRLKSRFERGLNVDLQPPDYETRVAILKKKIEDKNAILSENIISLMAQNITTNIRDLEASITTLIGYSELVGKQITEEIALSKLKHIFTKPVRNKISIDSIINVVASYHDLSLSDMKGRGRRQRVAYPRQIAMYISRELTDYSLSEIGLEFGGRDHTTVMHAYQKIVDLMTQNSNLEPQIKELMRSVNESGIT